MHQGGGYGPHGPPPQRGRGGPPPQQPPHGYGRDPQMDPRRGYRGPPRGGGQHPPPAQQVFSFSYYSVKLSISIISHLLYLSNVYNGNCGMLRVCSRVD